MLRGYFSAGTICGRVATGKLGSSPTFLTPHSGIPHNACMFTNAEQGKLAVDTREAARMLSVSPRTIQNYIRAKMLPARKLGRRTVIPVRALENFLRTDQPSPMVTNGENGENQ